MKKIIFLLLLLPFFTFGQSKGKSVKESFLVDGNCNMCKNRIETATLKLNGVKYVNWDSKSSNFSIIYNTKKVTIDEIRSKIAEVGHDNGEYKASLETYDKLPNCCRYRHSGKH